MTTAAANSGQRVVSVSSSRMLVTVSKPMSGSSSPKVTRPVKAASRSARTRLTRESWTRESWTRDPWTRPACAPACILDLLDIRPAEQALRQEDERDRQNGKGRHVLVVDGKIRRPQRLDQADDKPADHRPGQRADAAKHCGGEGFDARHETVGEGDDA